LSAHKSRRWLIIILAQQRSGTTVVRRTLAEGPDTHDFGEVFHEDYEREPTNFFSFKQRAVEENLKLLFPSVQNQTHLWSGYLDFLRKGTKKPLALIDVKYNSWHHLNTVWYVTGDMPDLVRHVRNDGVPVLHLVRDNAFAQACSSVLANARGIWQVESKAEADSDEPAHTLDAAQILVHMERSLEQTRLFRSFFSKHDLYEEVKYEELFEGTRLSATLYERMKRLAGRDVDAEADVALHKVIPQLDQMVANVEEIKDFFSGSPYEAQVEDAFRASSRDRPSSS
jgi:LPS sulfotransferase NodH